MNYRRIVFFLAWAFVGFLLISEPAVAWHWATNWLFDLRSITAGAIYGEEGVAHARLFNCLLLAVSLIGPSLILAGILYLLTRRGQTSRR